jgi:hypothetical protein
MGVSGTAILTLPLSIIAVGFDMLASGRLKPLYVVGLAGLLGVLV